MDLQAEAPRTAVPYFTESLALCRTALARFPRDGVRSNDLAEALRGLAQALEACDEHARAAELLREAAARIDPGDRGGPPTWRRMMPTST
jgi:tetratricopeptide (TPR) repeat protein